MVSGDLQPNVFPADEYHRQKKPFNINRFIEQVTNKNQYIRWGI